MDRSTELSDIARLARRLSTLETHSSGETAIIGFVAGALHALKRAAELGYDDSWPNIGTAELNREYHAALRATADLVSGPSQWLAGFYFNSALMRLDALKDRIRKLAGVKRKKLAHEVRVVVNRLKHDVDPYAVEWNVSFADALDAANALCRAFEEDMA